MDLSKLEPANIWKNFAALNAVPRPSKKEEKVIAFIEAFGNKLGLPTTKDAVGNVIIKKPATKGMENRKTVVLQSHLDMVHQKNADTKFDFNTEGIKMLVQDDWVKADGTTLGADNGIGVAAIMSILESDSIPHPPLEALFTIDEETGMTGALELKGGLLDADILLNLDTEDDDELTIGCAGGADVTATTKYTEIKTPSTVSFYKLSVKGLSGGHSGMEIHKGLGNANKIMNRLLLFADNKFNIYINSIDGGGLRNAIPRESFAIIGVEKNDTVSLEKFIAEQTSILKIEYASTDKGLQIELEKADAPAKVMEDDFQKKILRAIYACPNGIYRMSPDIPDLVQTSNNVARVEIKNGNASIQCLCRSSVNSEKEDAAIAITSAFELADCTVSTGGSYPGWPPAPHSEIVTIMSDLYTELFKGDAHVNACHAGLECGILGRNYPDMDMISFGPNIRGAHSPDERVQISSVQKFWKYLLETLQRIPVKN
ncbi:MAG: aminoacyl-histidine dipeptidase [Chitinophagales bacterium]|nr:aminoacyl-histidine dipeptidase [Bacteroidota bacterium]MBK8489133.1 aminoacyl-histidine dipeptidase [Bacteroidota bacterium]MBK8680982.1 aminoacyl-histidine dipeptidase [Bacteroidota bacterium]